MVRAKARAGAALRTLVRRRGGDDPAAGVVDVDGVIRTFCSIELVGPAPVDVRSDTIGAVLRRPRARSMSGLHVDIVDRTYRLRLPLDRLARLDGAVTFGLWLESGSHRWRLTRLPSPVRGALTLPSTVIRSGSDAIRVRITVNAEGALIVHTSSLAVAA